MPSMTATAAALALCILPVAAQDCTFDYQVRPLRLAASPCAHCLAPASPPPTQLSPLGANFSDRPLHRILRAEPRLHGLFERRLQGQLLC